jgi:hypothetical protein
MVSSFGTISAQIVSRLAQVSPNKMYSWPRCSTVNPMSVPKKRTPVGPTLACGPTSMPSASGEATRGKAAASAPPNSQFELWLSPGTSGGLAAGSAAWASRGCCGGTGSPLGAAPVLQLKAASPHSRTQNVQRPWFIGAFLPVKRALVVCSQIPRVDNPHTG